VRFQTVTRVRKPDSRFSKFSGRQRSPKSSIGSRWRHRVGGAIENTLTEIFFFRKEKVRAADDESDCRGGADPTGPRDPQRIASINGIDAGINLPLGLVSPLAGLLEANTRTRADGQFALLACESAGEIPEFRTGFGKVADVAFRKEGRLRAIVERAAFRF